MTSMMHCLDRTVNDMGERSDLQIKEDKATRRMNAVALWVSYYRANPHRFAEDFLGIQLKVFQKILLWAMMMNDAFYFVAARGIGGY